MLYLLQQALLSLAAQMIVSLLVADALCARNNDDFINKLLRFVVFSMLQQALLSLAAQLIVSLLVADALCARDNDDFKVKLLSSTNFMTGITTIAMVLIGVRYVYLIHSIINLHVYRI